MVVAARTSVRRKQEFKRAIGNDLFRWESKPNPKIVVDEAKEKHREISPANSPSSALKHQDTPEPPSPAPREILQPKNKEEKLASSKEKNVKEDKYGCWSPKDDRQLRKDRKKEKENKFKELIDDNYLSSERIIIGGEDAVKSTGSVKSNLPHELLAQFEGKSREVKYTRLQS